jgi:hypothetical protein
MFTGVCRHPEGEWFVSDIRWKSRVADELRELPFQICLGCGKMRHCREEVDFAWVCRVTDV